VELVGIRDYPVVDQPWWAPDGLPINVGQLRPQKCQLTIPTGLEARAFLIRFQGLPADASWPVWKLDHSYSFEGCSVVDANGKSVSEFKMLCASLRESIQAVNFQIGIGMGEWETVAQQKNGEFSPSTFNLDGKQYSVEFHPPSAGYMADSTQFMYVHAIKYERQLRVVAIDKDGIEHAPQFGLTQDYNDERQGGKRFTHVEYPRLPLSSIKEFKIQVRPYYWVEFKNVSLQSGHKTEVQVVPSYIEASPSQKPISKPDAGSG
jgi:hypothetical protein